jgi:hypothetical protein
MFAHSWLQIIHYFWPKSQETMEAGSWRCIVDLQFVLICEVHLMRPPFLPGNDATEQLPHAIIFGTCSFKLHFPAFFLT